jgi:hypothetical protein
MSRSAAKQAEKRQPFAASAMPSAAGVMASTNTGTAAPL